MGSGRPKSHLFHWHRGVSELAPSCSIASSSLVGSRVGRVPSRAPSLAQRSVGPARLLLSPSLPCDRTPAPRLLTQTTLHLSLLPSLPQNLQGKKGREQRNNGLLRLQQERVHRVALRRPPPLVVVDAPQASPPQEPQPQPLAHPAPRAQRHRHRQHLGRPRRRQRRREPQPPPPPAVPRRQRAPPEQRLLQLHQRQHADLLWHQYVRNPSSLSPPAETSSPGGGNEETSVPSSLCMCRAVSTNTAPLTQASPPTTSGRRAPPLSRAPTRS